MQIYDFELMLDAGYRGYHVKDYNYECFEPVTKEFTFGITPMSSTWEPLCVSRIDDSDDCSELPGLKYGDFSMLWTFTGGIILSRRAVEVLHPFLNDKVEFLPLVCDEPNVFVLMKVLNIYDYNEVLDEENSKIVWSHQTKRMIEAGFPKDFEYSRSHVLIFKEIAVENQLIFKIRQCNIQYTFVTQQFVDIIVQNNLTGGKFTRVYPPMAEELRQQAYEKAMKKRQGHKKTM